MAIDDDVGGMETGIRSSADDPGITADMNRYMAHSYDRSFWELLELMDLAAAQYRANADWHIKSRVSQEKHEPFAMHILTWNLSEFTLYLPEYEFLSYEDDGDLYLNKVVDEAGSSYLAGFSKVRQDHGLNASLVDFNYMNQRAFSLKQDKRRIESLAFHVIPRSGCHRAGEIYERVVLKPRET